MKLFHIFSLLLCISAFSLATGRRLAAGPVAPVPPAEHREVYADGRLFDITHKVSKDTPTWDSKEGLGQFLSPLASIKNGSAVNAAEVKMSVHTATHVDSPAHLFDNYADAGYDVDSLDLEVLNGPALLVDVPRDNNITADVMMSLNIPKGLRIAVNLLDKTGLFIPFTSYENDYSPITCSLPTFGLPICLHLMFKKEFDSSYTGFMKDGAKWLVENTDIKLVAGLFTKLMVAFFPPSLINAGLDYLSVAAYAEALDTHLEFLVNRVLMDRQQDASFSNNISIFLKTMLVQGSTAEHYCKNWQYNIASPSSSPTMLI
ncbi:hypothetical protein Q3G72_013584 [Acer saccharum]|nr:hypothetical protein Q3G72_013584 [Acer saccharum]